jgi:hypothetical protein
VVTDHEAVLVALTAFVASKTQHGREPLLTKIAELTAEHRVPAGELARLLRLYGVEVERARSISTKTTRDEAAAFVGGFGSSADSGLPGHHRPGGHDGQAVNGQAGSVGRG